MSSGDHSMQFWSKLTEVNPVTAGLTLVLSSIFNISGPDLCHQVTIQCNFDPSKPKPTQTLLGWLWSFELFLTFLDLIYAIWWPFNAILIQADQSQPRHCWVGFCPSDYFQHFRTRFTSCGDHSMQFWSKLTKANPVTAGLALVPRTIFNISGPDLCH